MKQSSINSRHLEEDVFVDEAEVVVQLGDDAGEDALFGGGRRPRLRGARRRVRHGRHLLGRQRRRDRDARLRQQ